MNPAQSSATPNDDRIFETACGATIRITPDTPFAYYRNEVVYFCEQCCKQMYDQDPLSSCLAARILSSK